jgi:hypothetical protein
MAKKIAAPTPERCLQEQGFSIFFLRNQGAHLPASAAKLADIAQQPARKHFIAYFLLIPRALFFCWNQ